MSMTLGVLGSGSSGNSFVVRAGSTTIAIDAGFSGREQDRRLRAIAIEPESLEAVLLTHEHTDHSSGCRVWCDKWDIPLYASCGTSSFLQSRKQHPKQLISFENDRTFEIGDILISPFSVPHDACDPVGFTLHYRDCKIGIATDLGELSESAAGNLYDCDGLIIECNYENSMLRDSLRHERLKRRIAGRHGHLELTESAKALEQLVTPRTRLVLYSHISSECNSPVLAEDSGRQQLKAMGREDITFAVIPQHQVLGKFIFGEEKVDFIEPL